MKQSMMFLHNVRNLGAMQNRLEHTINNLWCFSRKPNCCRITHPRHGYGKRNDGVYENNILTQAAQAMFAQANQVPQGVLQLLR